MLVKGLSGTAENQNYFQQMKLKFVDLNNEKLKNFLQSMQRSQSDENDEPAF